MSQTKKCVNYLCNGFYKLLNCNIDSKNVIIKFKSDIKYK